MPTVTKEPAAKTETSLFIGLQSYTEAQSNIFYGRDEEIDRLTNLVKANTLTIVFGKSGTGKTSLLNAGVFPRLRKDFCLPFRIRLEFHEDSPHLVEQIKLILKSEIDKYGFTVEAYPSTETLWEYFHREPLWNSVTPILIFDQFEEIFTLGRKSNRFAGKELAEFWEELANLIENSIPESLKEKFLNNKENVGYNYKLQKVKTLFAFREEYLPEFEGITAKIPSIKYSRFRLMPMNGNQAYEVITKTWKNNIDAEQAKKVVGFFSKEEGKNTPFDVMEIEPSLLSQVCSFIDKERLISGKQTISAEFLNKYPKAIILSSIYNEVLDESNAVVLNNLNHSKTITRPVNEFVEDKLITDEGYRTKYALTQQDAAIKPGIEILKTKYFVRDDGKSVELTHDVLTPIIKSDRESRRKGIAMALAKKKANRRALLIVGVALLSAVLIWYFTTNKAFQEKAKAENDKAVLDLQIKSATISLDSLDESIESTKATLEKLKGTTNGFNVSLGADTAYYQNLLIRSVNDSIQLVTQKEQLEDLKSRRDALEKDIDLQKEQMAHVNDSLRKIWLNSRADKRNIANLESRLSRDSGKLAWLQKSHNDLVKQYNSYIHQVSVKEIDEDIIVDDKLIDTNSLKLNLNYSFAKNDNSKLPRNLKIYLIPESSSNKKIIRNASTYEMYCDELNLDRAQGKKIARYRNGAYTFYDVAPGKYFVKICAYYGGFYSYTKKSIGNDSVSWDASPPIR